MDNGTGRDKGGRRKGEKGVKEGARNTEMQREREWRRGNRATEYA